MEQDTVYVGIDVSKSSFDLAVHGTARVTTFAMTCPGISKAINEIHNKGTALVALESTGGYEKPLVKALAHKGIPTALINPGRIRDYARANGILAKTDSLDARVIAAFAANLTPDVNAEVAANSYAFKELAHRIQTITDQITAENNRKGQPLSSPVAASIQRHLRMLEEEKERLMEELAGLIERDEKVRRRRQILMSCPGIGPISSMMLLAHLPELGLLNRAEIASLAGLAPFNRDSGKFRGRRTIYGGRYAARRALYMPALVAVRYNERIKAHYLQLQQRGKCKKVALIACMRKLLVTLNEMIRNDELYTAHRCIT